MGESYDARIRQRMILPLFLLKHNKKAAKSGKTSLPKLPDKP
jgi:hypothetical protein